MKQIWKYTLKRMDKQTVGIPEGGVILTVQMQHNEPQMWVLVEPEADKRPRDIIIHGTGHGVPEKGLVYISTVQDLGGALLWHIFEQRQKEGGTRGGKD